MITKRAEQKADVEVCRRLLVEKRQQLMRALGMKFETMADMGRLAEEDQAQFSHDEFVSVRLNSLDYVQLRLINEALDRIRNGDYGTCQSCDQPIPAKRLLVLPWARYCVPCQEEIGSQNQGPAPPDPRRLVT